MGIIQCECVFIKRGGWDTGTGTRRGHHLKKRWGDAPTSRGTAEMHPPPCPDHRNRGDSWDRLSLPAFRRDSPAPLISTRLGDTFLVFGPPRLCALLGGHRASPTHTACNSGPLPAPLSLTRIASHQNAGPTVAPHCSWAKVQAGGHHWLGHRWLSLRVRSVGIFGTRALSGWGPLPWVTPLSDCPAEAAASLSSGFLQSVYHLAPFPLCSFFFFF